MIKRERICFEDLCEMIAQYYCCTKIGNGKVDGLLFYSSEINNFDLAELLCDYSIDLLEEPECVIK